MFLISLFLEPRLSLSRMLPPTVVSIMSSVFCIMSSVFNYQCSVYTHCVPENK